MENEDSELSSLSGPQIMDEGLVNIFSCMIRHGEIIDALDFIRSIEVNFRPCKTVMRTIIFEILMKSDDVKCLAFAADYLETILCAFPPVNDENRQFYYDSIRYTHGFLADLWAVFCHMVDSYFCQRKIYDICKEDSSFDPLKYPNCKFLLEFYLKLFTVDFEHRSSDSSASCLVMKLLWPKLDSGVICLTYRTEQLFKWINDIYGCTFAKDMGVLLGCMHSLLTLMIKCIMHSRRNLSDFAAFSHPDLGDIVEALMNFCKNAFISLPNVKLFLNSLSIKYLQAKVSEKIIRQIIRLKTQKSYVRTLKDIVDQCMFPSKFKKFKNTKPSVSKEKILRKRLNDKKTNCDKKISSTFATTILHEQCRKNKFGDLLQELQSSSEKINDQDRAGNTPLHEACDAGHLRCVRVLIDETGSTGSLDFTAINFAGQTPLHLAVIKNSIEIATLLLDNGGSELLTISDNMGQRPSDLSGSEEMNKVLQDYHHSDESDSSVDTRVREAPILKSFKEYSIYLHTLNCLLCTYCHVFNLYDFVWNKNTVVRSHEDKTCCHFMGEDICSEDATLITEMPDMIETFIESVCKNISKSELNLDIELIPLKTFAASLKAL